AHEVEMLQTLQMTAINGDLPPVHIIGIVPHVIGHEMTFELSPACVEGAKTMEQLVLRRLRELGFTATQVDTQPLQALAHTTFRGF
ncbi:MAG: hydrogenase expression/formation protein, partial [Helicobacter sp.]|nr:hydrogenase expression/formation protein [Helicobacter sp.]